GRAPAALRGPRPLPQALRRGAAPRVLAADARALRQILRDRPRPPERLALLEAHPRGRSHEAALLVRPPPAPGRPPPAPAPRASAGLEHGDLGAEAGLTSSRGEPDALRPEPPVSRVIPVFNEEDVLPLLLPRLRALLDGLAPGSEVCFINDGSHDASLRMLEAAAAADPRLKIIDFSRNFGHPAAITTGLDHARGDAVVLMDADLQDPPELVSQMVALYRKGYDVVHARRTSPRDEPVFKKMSAWAFSRLLRVVGHRDMPANVGEFGLMSRDVVVALRALRERHRLVRGLVAWVGFRQTNLDFERPGRAARITKYPLPKMLLLAWH